MIRHITPGHGAPRCAAAGPLTATQLALAQLPERHRPTLIRTDSAGGTQRSRVGRRPFSTQPLVFGLHRDRTR
ncbi:hypothetical protein [Streptomyces sp. NPDC057428]|uniref:hypothetical protein n=1 Tax=Streptomyces sp. NPDC057428 TaxID=3346129 RepID=UPI0036B2FDC3